MMLLANNENKEPKRIKDITTEFTGNYYLKFFLADTNETELEFVGSRADFEILNILIQRALDGKQ